MDVNTRELALNILLEINRDGEHSHIAIGNTLAKYQFLQKGDRAFITRLCEGTIEYKIQLDYIIDFVSSVKVRKMKPVIREILRMSVYQLKYMDHVPDRAVVNEAVKLAQRKGFHNLKNFVNGVLRNTARRMNEIPYPDRRQNPIEYLSIHYSVPEALVKQWCEEFGESICEQIIGSFLNQRPTTVRLCRTGHDPEETLRELKNQCAAVKKAPYAADAYEISGYDHLGALQAFQEGKIQVQDVSSMLVAQVAAPVPGIQVLDVCAAPGGKSLHVADLMNGQGMVEARDLTEYKVNLIRDNIERLGLVNIRTNVRDASLVYEEDMEHADLVLADVPCSGYGVIGKKPDIKYHSDQEQQASLLKLQREILKAVASYVKRGGVLIYSTCTIGKAENLDQVLWFTEHFPFQLESLNPYLSPELHSETTAQGYLQLLPGIHACDGFFLARLRKK